MLSIAASISRVSTVPGLLLWLDARSLPAPGPVSSWGVASAPSANNYPTYSATGLNGRPAVIFDGENDCMTLPLISAGSSWVAFVVCRRDGGGAYGQILSALSSANTLSAGLAINDDATKGPLQASSASAHVMGGEFATGQPRILTMSPTALKQNNVAASAVSMSSPFTAAGTLSMLGAANSSAPSRFFAGAISELRLYSSLTAGQEASIYAELAGKWGIA